MNFAALSDLKKWLTDKAEEHEAKAVRFDELAVTERRLAVLAVATLSKIDELSE